MSISKMLPEELLALVFGSLDAQKDQSTVSALRLTSKTFERLARPLQWRIARGRGSVGGKVPRLSALHAVVGTLHKYPQLALLVKELIEVDDIKERDWQHWKDFSDFPNGTYLPAIAEASLFGHDRREVMNGPSDGPAAAWLLRTCTQLEILRSSRGYLTDSREVGAIISQATRYYAQSRYIDADIMSVNSGLLDSLKEIHLGHKSGRTELVDALDLFYLPRLRALSITELEHRKHSRSPTEPTAPVVRRSRNENPFVLKLDRCNLSMNDLGLLLSALSNLRHLTVRWSGLLDRNQVRDYENNPYVVTGEILNEHSPNLQYLHLNDIDRRERDTSGQYRSEDIGNNFAKLLNLHTLAVPVRALDASTFILPPALTELFALGVDPQDHGMLHAWQGDSELAEVKELVYVPNEEMSLGSRMRPGKRCVDYDKAGLLDLRNWYSDLETG